MIIKTLRIRQVVYSLSVRYSIKSFLYFCVMKNIIITGGAGFIGSHVVRRFVTQYPQYQIHNVDKLTYAGNLLNLTDIAHYPNYHFHKVDIVDTQTIAKIVKDYEIDAIIHLAAESHVDRSILGPKTFIETNIVGTFSLLEVVREAWKDKKDVRFYHVSTDEVYGSLGETGMFTETTPYDPRSPYSSSKAASDHLVRAYGHTYNIPYVVSNCSNNYGSHQFPEKLIPLCIQNILQNKPLPIYGKGENVRDWLWVNDHAQAIDVIFHNAENGQTYNIGGHNEKRNLDVVKYLCDEVDKQRNIAVGTSQNLITFVKDRPGHDARYAIDSSKLQKELGWKPSVTFEQGLEHTVRWYLENQEWVQQVISGEYQKYYETQYHNR